MSWLIPVAVPPEKRLRAYPVMAFVVKPEGVVEAVTPPEPTEEELKAFLDAKLSPIWFWHSGQAALCLQQALPDGRVGYAGVKASAMKAAGLTVDEVEFARELPRVPGTGLEVGGDARAEAQAAHQRALLQRAIRGKR